MEWVPGAYEPVIVPGLQIRPAQRRGRLASDHVERHPQMYYNIDGNGLMVPAGPAGGGRVRAASASDYHRPAQIVIKNEFDSHSPQRSPQRHHRHSSHGHDHHYDDYSDDSFESRAYSPHRHRSRHRSRRRSHHRRSPSRTPSPYEHYDFEKEKMKAKLEELEQREHAKEEEKRLRKEMEEEMLLEEARKVKKKKDEEAFKKKAIEEYNIKQIEEKAKKDQEKKEAEEEYRKRVKKDFAEFDEEEIDRIIKGKKKEHGHAHDHGHDHGHGHAIHQIVKLDRPTHIRVRRKHLSTETLNIYELPWYLDEVRVRLLF